MNNKISNTEIDVIISNISEWDNLTYDEIHKDYFAKFKRIPIPTLRIQKEFLITKSVFRTRLKSSFKNIEDIYDYNKFSCLPINQNSNIGRCNWENRNVFYGSLNALVTLQESKDEFKKENEFYIGDWGFTNNLPDEIPHTAFLPKDINKDNPWEQFVTDLDKSTIADLHEIFEDPVYFKQQIANLFIRDINDNKEYKPTAFIADQILHGVNQKNSTKIRFPILVYPSVPSSTTDCNLAIHPYVVNGYMKLNRIYHVSLQDNNEVKLIKTAIVDDKKKIDWHSPTVDYENVEYRIEYIICECGEKFSYEELKTIEIYEKGKKTSLDNLIYTIKTKHKDSILDLKNTPFSFKEEEPSNSASILIIEKLENYTLIKNNQQHKNPFIRIEFEVNLVPILIKKSEVNI